MFEFYICFFFLVYIFNHMLPSSDSSTGSTKEDPSQHDWKIVDWDVMHHRDLSRPDLEPNNGPFPIQKLSENFSKWCISFPIS